MLRPMSLKIVLLGGEGIGPEVVEATAEVLEHLLPTVTFVRPIHGKPALDAHGDAMPEASRALCREADAVLFGATQQYCHPVLRFLRWGLDTYANLRPSRTRPGLSSPLADKRPLDIFVVRENLEGEYPGREGEMADFNARWPDFVDNIGRPMPEEGLFTLRLTTDQGTRRVATFAAELAKKRAAQGLPGKVTIVTKANVLRKTDGFFRATAQEILDAAGVPHVHYFVDDACRRMVAEPWNFDVVLCPNLFGDIVSDILAELTGGMGMAPSGCVGTENAYFEAVHGSAPDIAGQGIANPLATVLSAQMMLEHLGRTDEAAAVDAAVDRLLTDAKILPRDLGGTATTADVTRALIALL